MTDVNPSISTQQLRTIIDTTFNDAELRQLCFDLKIPYEDLGSEGKAGKVVELIRFCERRNILPDLIQYVQRTRPSAFNQPPPNQRRPEQKYQSPTQQTTENLSREMSEILEEREGLSDETIEQMEQLRSAYQPDEHPGADGAIEDSSSPAAEAAQTSEPELSNAFQTLESHNGTLLTSQHGVQIYGLQIEKSWNLSVDAFVLPLDYGTTYSLGRDGRDLEADLIEAGFAPLADVYHKTIEIREAPLTPETPFLLLESPSHFWTLPKSERKVIAATANDGSRFSAENATTAASAIVQLAVANQLRHLTMPVLGAGAAGLPESAVALAMLDAILEAIPEANDDSSALDEIILTAVNAETLAALRQKFLKRPQAARNDQPVGPDLLQVETAVYALAEMCMLKETEAPLAVGILGGWGSGKSFIMHLMQERVAQLRALKIGANSLYIGHVYQIKFDAWTYAKSNLWASLMQTIFYELNAQLTRERELASALGATDDDASLKRFLGKGGALWQVLTYPNIKPQQAQDIINFATELAPILRPLPPKQVLSAAQTFLHGRRSESDAEEQPEDLLWSELRKLKETELENLRETEKVLAEKQAALENAKIKLRKEVDKEIAQEARTAAWTPLQNAFKQQFGKATDSIKKQFVEGEEGESVSFWQSLEDTAVLGQMIRNNPTEFAAFLILSLAMLGLTIVAQQDELIQLPAAVVSLGSFLMAFVRVYDKWIGLIRNSFVAYQLQVEAERNRLEDGREDRIQQKIAQQIETYNAAKLPDDTTIMPSDNIPGLEEEIATLEAKAKRQRQRVGITASYVSLLDFVSSRLDDAVYEKELGLMHQVQRDLEELSDSLTTEGHDLFPRGGARVILYIDDLDRCPPLRVVEVLEAVQLLLKTNLFIVVLAIDVRFITRALETVYKGILTRRGSPSGLDYIEKIIQIPYRIQPIEEKAVGNYLEKQMKVAPKPTTEGTEAEETTTAVTGTTTDEASSSTEETERTQERSEQDTEQQDDDGREHDEEQLIDTIEISQPEFESMKTCCQQVTMTPRAIKRLANVYKLLKIIWHYDNTPTPSQTMIDVIMTLLALSERYPNQMRDLFEHIVIQIKSNSDENLADFFAAQAPESKQDTYVAQEWKHLTLDARNLVKDISFAQIDLEIINQVRSFCFVGDIGHEPDEWMKALHQRNLEDVDNEHSTSSANSAENSEKS